MQQMEAVGWKHWATEVGSLGPENARLQGSSDERNDKRGKSAPCMYI